jgi:hypothetical protein
VPSKKKYIIKIFWRFAFIKKQVSVSGMLATTVTKIVLTVFTSLVFWRCFFCLELATKYKTSIIGIINVSLK